MSNHASIVLSNGGFALVYLEDFDLCTGAANMTMEKANKATAWMDKALGQKEAYNG